MTFPYIVDIKLYPVKSSGCSPRRSKCDLRPLSAHKTAESRKSVSRNKFLISTRLIYIRQGRVVRKTKDERKKTDVSMHKHILLYILHFLDAFFASFR